MFGAGTAARDHPKREVFDRRVVAHNAPPPAEVPFAKREKQLQKHPGRALEPAAVKAVQSPQDRRARNVLVISDQKEVIDRRAAATAREDKQGKPESLDRSVVARHTAERVRSAEQLPGTEKQADNDKKAAQQQQRQAEPKQSQDDRKHQQSRSKAQADCEREARKQNQNESRCQDEL